MRIYIVFILLSFLSIKLIAQKNLALNKSVVASTQFNKFKASNITDGIISDDSKWVNAVRNDNGSNIIEIDLKYNCDIDSIIIYTGINSDKKNEEISKLGNFVLQYWDDANWTELSETGYNNNNPNKIRYTFSPRVTTSRIRLNIKDKTSIGINEIEVYGNERDFRSFNNIINDIDNIKISVSNNVVGKTMKYVGYNQGYYMPESNVSGWLEYSNVNSLRIWASIGQYVPSTALFKISDINSLEEFENNKRIFRESPEKNSYIDWKLINSKCTDRLHSTNSMVFEYALKETKRLNIEPVIQINSTEFDKTWNSKWKQWLRYYALAFYAAKTGDVEMFSMQNEPNHKHSGPMKIDIYIDAMKIVSDAIYCALSDVNKFYGKNLTPKLVAPVTAGNNANWWSAVIKSLNVDYRGLPTSRELISIFSTHSYNLPASGYKNKVNEIRKIITDNHPLKQSLPIVFTETGRWMNAYLINKYETMDSPSLFTEWAGIYANNTLNQSYGMWAFKFANTVSDAYPRGIKSGHHFIWQGKRIVEDSYNNIALNKPTFYLNSGKKISIKNITDGNKSDKSAWCSPETDNEKILEIDLGKEYSLGGSVIYTGGEYGVYTAPDRVKNLRLQYLYGDKWLDIEETIEKDTKYAQVLTFFKNEIKTSKVRLIVKDKGKIKVREIKLFDYESLKEIPESFDISGIQRTGEVVRLFAKGFKDEKPLLRTCKSVNDSNVDVITSFDDSNGSYYIWLVQRNKKSVNVELALDSLKVLSNNIVFAEEVSNRNFGNIVWMRKLDANKRINFILPEQSVTLLTVPLSDKYYTKLTPVADTTVSAGKNSNKNYGSKKKLYVEMNASNKDKNRVSYIKFNLNNIDVTNMKGAALKVHGKTNSDSIYRIHVYSTDNCEWQEKGINWNSAPFLNKDFVYINDVGKNVRIAGEVAFDSTSDYRQVDVSEIIKNMNGDEITFIFIREVRQLGDDYDNDNYLCIDSKETDYSPELILW